MRSVPMLGRPAGLSFGNPPALGLVRSSSNQAKPQSKIFGVKSEWTASAASSVWDVKAEDLEMVPTDFPLERTHREIHESAEVVCKRLSETLCKLSVQAEYKETKAKCTTNDCVSFRIRLYSGDECGQPVVVEIQRRCGSASSFMKTCRAILDAAEGRVVKVNKVAKPFSMKAPCNMVCLKQATMPPVDVSKIVETVFNKRVRSDRQDLQLLGLEELCSLTDVVKASPMAAMDAALHFLTTEDLREDVAAFCDRDSFADESMVPKREEKRHLAFTVFANAVQVCGQEGRLAKLVTEHAWFAETLISMLFVELQQAKSYCCNAYQVCRCLLPLLACSETCKGLVYENKEVLIDAHSYGVRHHELLEAESKECLALLA